MATIQLKTSIPGPKSKALGDRRSHAVPRGLSHATPIYVAKTEGAILEDVDGNRYIDFAGGIGCLNTGHRAPGVLTAIERQLDKFLHTCVQVTPYESYIRLAERLNQITPGNFPKKTLFVNSGAEAVENAVKIARAATGRPGIIAFEDAFHGRTMMTLALTSKTHPYKAGFQPFPGEVYRIPFAYCYRCSYSRSEEHTSELQSLTNLVCRLLLEKKNKKSKKIAHYVMTTRQPPLTHQNRSHLYMTTPEP